MTSVTAARRKARKGIFRELYETFRDGDAATRLSFLVMGFGSLVKGQVIKGLLYLGSQALMVWYLAGFAWQYLSKLDTLGDVGMQRVWSEERQIFVRTPGDNSLLILLFSVLSIMLVLGFLVLWRANIRSAYKAQRLKEQGKPLPTFGDDITSMVNERYHITLLTMPTLMVLAFTLLPTIFMILLAFTNFDQTHQPPGNMFTWVGTENFRNLFGGHPLIANTFGKVLGWTMIWAVIATFTNYLLGMVLAQVAGEGKAQIGNVRASTGAHKAVHVHANQRGGGEVVSGLFQHLAHAGLQRGFGRVQVAGRGVQAQTVAGVLFDQEKAVVPLHNGRHRDIGFPAIRHSRALSAVQPPGR